MKFLSTSVTFLVTSTLSQKSVVAQSCAATVEKFQLWKQNEVDLPSDDFAQTSTRYPSVELKDGDQVCYEQVGDNIEAVMSCQDEVWLKIDNAVTGERIKTRKEGLEPYFLFGNQGDNIPGEILEIGKYTMTAYAVNNDAEQASITFEVIDCNRCEATVVRFRLWYKNDEEQPADVKQDSSRYPYVELNEGDKVCYNDFGDNIEAVMSCQDEVWLKIDNVVTGERVKTRKESVEPYFLFGDWSGVIHGQPLEVGKYRMTAYAVNNEDVQESVNFEVVDCNACDIEKFRIWLRNDDQRDCDTELSSSRDLVADLAHGNYVCYEFFGDSIEAVMSSDTCTKPVSMQLSNAVTGEQVATRYERFDPYFLFGNWEEVVFGKTLGKGKYRMTATADSEELAETIDFEVIDCNLFSPANECGVCPEGQACAGSRCVSEGYNRISLVYFGSSAWDLGLKVTTPDGNTIAAFSDMSEDDFPTNDDSSGAFVDEDYKLPGCESYGVWVKNIVFPSQDRAPTGTYQISLVDRDDCGAGGSPPTDVRFELNIYQNGELVEAYTESQTREFSVAL